MIFNSELRERIYKLERKINDLEFALVHAGVFTYDDRLTYDSGYARLVINEVKSK